jgi:uncharacterized protein (DUF1697 family)
VYTRPEFSIALLRGINVGGKNILPMKDLTAIFGAAGCTDVKTYIQSGNVIFRAEPKLMKNLAGDVSARIVAGFGIKAPVVLRTHGELKRTVANNPYLNTAANEKALFVMFLAAQPDSGDAAALDPQRSPPDQFTVYDRDIYLNLANGAATTKLTNQYFDSRLKTVSTARNWRTVLKLFELTSPE